MANGRASWCEIPEQRSGNLRAALRDPPADRFVAHAGRITEEIRTKVQPSDLDGGAEMEKILQTVLSRLPTGVKSSP
jgi:hypothetical protein